MHYDAFLFVQALRTKFWLGMLSAIDAALMDAARLPAAKRRAGAPHPGDDIEFMRFLIAARAYLLSEGRLRPDGLSDEQLLLLKVLCEHLVSQGRFPPERLRLFADLDPWRVSSLPDTDLQQRHKRM